MQLDLELYRRDVIVSEQPRVRLSVIDIDPGLELGTMVFLHGFGGRAPQWKAQIEAFVDDYHIIAPDLRGHGRSDAPFTSYSLEEMLSDLEVVLRETEAPARFILFGHSFGGAVAAAYAARHPERVERLILIGTAARFELSRWIRVAYRVPTAVLQPIMTRFMRYI